MSISFWIKAERPCSQRRIRQYIPQGVFREEDHRVHKPLLMLLSFKSIRYITINRLAVNFPSWQFQGFLVTLNSYNSCYCPAIRTLSICPSVFIAHRFLPSPAANPPPPPPPTNWDTYRDSSPRLRKFNIISAIFGSCFFATVNWKGRNSCLWLQSRSVLSSSGVELMSCRVNFQVVRSALQYSACTI